MAVQKRTMGGDPSWDDIRALAAVIEAGTLSGAARLLGLNHATIGRRLQALERDAGARLIERRGDRWILTPAGETLRAPALAMAEAARGLVRRSAATPGLVGRVRVTAPPLMAERLLIPRLGPLMVAHPGLELSVIADNRSLSLDRREAEIALRLARPRDGDLLARRVAVMAYAVYGLAGLPPDAPWLAYDESDPLLSATPEARWLAARPPPTPIALRANSGAALLAAALAGHGRALIPVVMAADHPELVQLGGEAGLPRREIWLLRHRDLRQSARVAVVADFIAALFRTERARFG
ncbi:MAG: LysR family transcriptional regulator [Alphaproteobacteria bacterium]|jgi:DNA-binding transcriptional LysR family regulator|nr:LysR family transcriptional regulator [Alphaproteobacteria bacterium]